MQSFFYGLIILLVFAILMWLFASALGSVTGAGIFFFVALIVLFLILLSMLNSWRRKYNN